MKLKHLVLAALVSVAFLSCTEKGPEGLAVSGGDDIVFGSFPTHTLSFDIAAGSPWTIEKSDLNWVVVSPLEGDGSTATTVYIAAEDNAEDAVRSGQLIVRSGNLTEAVPVYQRPAFALSDVSFGGFDPSVGLTFAAEPDTVMTVKVYSRYDWKLDTDQTLWEICSPLSGSAQTVTELRLKPVANGAEFRRIPLKVVPSIGVTGTIPVEQSPYVAQPVLIAWWSIGDNDFMHEWNDSHSDCWLGNGYVPADKPEGTTATMTFHPGGEYKITYIISADGNGHWAMKPVWDGDILEFEIPVSSIPAKYTYGGGLPSGTVVNMKFAISGLASMAKYWLAEYFEGGEWKAISSSEFVASDGASVTATFQLDGSNVVHDIDLSATFQSKITDSVKMRIRPISCRYNNDGKISTSSPSGNALRIRPGSSFGEANDAISFYIYR